MGAGGSSSPAEALLKDFSVVRRIDVDGLLFLRHTRTSEDYLLRQLTFNDRREFDKCTQMMEQRKNQLNGCKFLAALDRIATRSEDQYCSTFYKVYALFEFGERTLEQEISERRTQGRRFAQSELWSLLASCILGLAHLQKQGIRHEGLRSSAILISKQGVVRVYDPLATGTPSNYDSLCQRRSSQHLYLSPELAECLQHEVTTSSINPYKADIFTLGMVVIEAGLLQYQDECYRDDCSRIHWETVQYNLHRFQQAYSEDLASMVELMLSREEKARPDWLQLEERVIREQENKAVSLLNISREGRPNQLQGKVGSTGGTSPFITSQVVPLFQGGSSTQRHSHLYRPKPPPPPPSFPLAQHQYTPAFDISSRFSSPPSKPPQEHTLRMVCIAPSNIEPTRPLRSIFPISTYVTATKIDENLIVVEQERTFEAETPNNRNNSSYFDSYPKSSVENSVPQYHTYTPPPSQPPPEQPTVNTYAPSFFQNPNSNPNPNPVTVGEYVVQRYKQGSQYKGYKVQGMRHGQGVFYYQDGGMYQGEWQFNKMQGQGKLYYQSGKLAYEGLWANDQFSGHGVLYNEYPDVLHTPINYKNLDEVDEFWTKYEGQFREDLKSGHGTLFLSNGEYYQGEFHEDMANGQGKFMKMDGEVVIGRWLNNMFLG